MSINIHYPPTFSTAGAASTGASISVTGSNILNGLINFTGVGSSRLFQVGNAIYFSGSSVGASSTILDDSGSGIYQIRINSGQLYGQWIS